MDEIYHVAFYKRLADSTGHQAEPCQGAVEVCASCESRAIDLARRRFEQLAAVPDWRFRADYEKLERLPRRKRISKLVWQRSLQAR